MDELKITKERILELIPKFFDDVLKSEYSNPIKSAVEAAVKSQESHITKMVNDVIAECLTTPEFEAELKRQVIGRILTKALKD